VWGVGVERVERVAAAAGGGWGGEEERIVGYSSAH
jgi:hypothetical protein